MLKKIKSILKGKSSKNAEKLYTLTCISEFQPTSQSKSLTFEIPTELQTLFQWQAGQYVSILLDIEGKKVWRDYSIYSVPNPSTFSICVKEVENGFASKYLVDNTFQGQQLEMTLPKGRFVLPLKPNEKRSIAAFCAGSGITPVFSIIQDVLQNEKNAQFHLFYGNKTPDTTLFKKEIEELQQSFPEQFFPYFVYSQFKNENPLFNGRLNKQKLELYINQILDWDEFDKILICGPNEMAVEIREACLDKGMHSSQILTEFFVPIQQEVQKEKAFSPVKVEVILDGEAKEIVWKSPSVSLLDVMLDNDIDAPYSCKGGVCGTCVCTIKGEASMGEQLSLVESDIAEGKFLPCVCHHATTDLLIDFDNV